MEIVITILLMILLIMTFKGENMKQKAECCHAYKKTNSHFMRVEGKRTIEWTCKKCNHQKEQVIFDNGYSFYQ
ncbi:MAG: hypothetical protein ACI9YH_000141 [Colwellia sp.]|jgi:hypothetical protein